LDCSFRLLLIGYFEGLHAERAIACVPRTRFALREFLGLVLPEAPPDHSTISRTRRLIDLETHQAVFTWILQQLADAGLVKGKTVGIDATTLEANAALRSIMRRDTGESYQDFLTKLAQASASKRRRGPIWHGSIGSGRERARTTTGPIRTIPTRRSRR
jgi:transposase